jgi:hypothetical protein
MRKAICEVVSLTALVFVLLGMCCQAFAQEKNPSSSVTVSTSEAAPPAAVSEALYRTYVFHGNGPAPIPAATWTAVDAVHTIQCPGTTGSCTITADISVQEVGSTASNGGAVALEVDGILVCTSDASNGCHYAVEIPSDGRFVEANELNSLSSVALGFHTVQTFVWSDNGASGGFYNIRYAVYKP